MNGMEKSDLWDMILFCIRFTKNILSEFAGTTGEDVDALVRKLDQTARFAAAGWVDAMGEELAEATQFSVTFREADDK